MGKKDNKLAPGLSFRFDVPDEDDIPETSFTSGKKNDEEIPKKKRVFELNLKQRKRNERRDTTPGLF